MDIKPIKMKADYQAALKEIETLMQAKPRTAMGDRLEVLVTLVEAYEAKHYPLDLPDPVEAIHDVSRGRQTVPGPGNHGSSLYRLTQGPGTPYRAAFSGSVGRKISSFGRKFPMENTFRLEFSVGFPLQRCCRTMCSLECDTFLYPKGIQSEILQGFVVELGQGIGRLRHALCAYPLRLGLWLSFAKHTPAALVPRYCRVSAESSLIQLEHDECARGNQRAKPPTRVTFHFSVLFNGIRQPGMRRTVTTPGRRFNFGHYSGPSTLRDYGCLSITPRPTFYSGSGSVSGKHVSAVL